MTAEKIIEYCRAARYENLAYTSQPAAREAGLPGIIAPPAMVFTYAPVQLAGLAAARGRKLPDGLTRFIESAGPATASIAFQGVMVVPGDAISSFTSVQDKFQQEEDRFATIRVVAHNQRGDLVADYSLTCRWPSDPQ